MGALVCSKTAAAFQHPPTLAHLEGTAGKQGQQREWEQAQALFCKTDISYHYPPCPRQTLPVRWRPPGREMLHRPPAPSRSPEEPPQSWAGRGRAAAVSRDLPACLAAPIPPTRPPQTQHSAGSIPVFIQHKQQRNFSFFFVPNSLQRDKRLRACSTEDNANISGAEESSQHKSLEREEVQQGLGFAPLPMWGVPGAVNACSEQAGAWCRMRWLKGSPAEEL